MMMPHFSSLSSHLMMLHAAVAVFLRLQGSGCTCHKQQENPNNMLSFHIRYKSLFINQILISQYHLINAERTTRSTLKVITA